MRKTQIAFIIVILLCAFGAIDFYLNGLDKNFTLDFGNKTEKAEAATPIPIPIRSVYKVNDVVEGFTVLRQMVTAQIFDKIDVSSLSKIEVVKTVLQKAQEPITIYEVHGPKNQGSFTYLGVKLQFIAQINATTETLNEVGTYGDNSFYFNDLNNASTAFLLFQSGDDLYGFQYSKKNPQTLESIKKIIQTLTLKP